MKIKLYTDGACAHRVDGVGLGGWAAILLAMEGDRVLKEKTIHGHEHGTTNNRMELTAVIEGLLMLDHATQLTVYTDAKYVVNPIQKGWVLNWERDNWKNRKNADLWMTLLGGCRVHRVHFEWVKGHDGNYYNERCDEIAQQAIGEAKDQA